MNGEGRDEEAEEGNKTSEDPKFCSV